VNPQRHRIFGLGGYTWMIASEDSELSSVLVDTPSSVWLDGGIR
jgi:hypothetical protein